MFAPATSAAFCRHGEAIDETLLQIEERYRRPLTAARHAEIELF